MAGSRRRTRVGTGPERGADESVDATADTTRVEASPEEVDAAKVGTVTGTMPRSEQPSGPKKGMVRVVHNIKLGPEKRLRAGQLVKAAELGADLEALVKAGAVEVG